MLVVKNKIDMSTLKECFESAGFTDVSTYLNSGDGGRTTEQLKIEYTTDIELALMKIGVMP